MAVVIAVDAGTTGVRSLAVNEAGAFIAKTYREFPQHFPRPGWVEHEADDIWEATRATLAELVETLDQPVAAIGITNQRETTVVWSRSTGEPLSRAIVWQDRRTADRCGELTQAGQLDMIRHRTGLVLDPYFSGTKLEWLLGPGGVEAGPDLAFGTVDSWLLYNLTGGAVHATEPSNASRTMLYDIRDGDWSPELLDLLGAPASAMPDIRPTSGRFGTTAEGVPTGPGIPVSGIAGDQQAALFGQACFSPGMAKNTYGTGSFVLMNVGPSCPDPIEGLLTTVAWGGLDGAAPDQLTYALEGAIFVTGAAVQWLRDGLGIIEAAPEIGPLAESCEDTGGVHLVPAFTGLGSPWWDPYARGAVVGITRGTGRAELARATVESMAFQTRDVVDAMTAASGHTIPELRVDGGASVMDLLCQFQADQLQATVTRPVVEETTALGAAYLAGLAEGVWASTDDIVDAWAPDRRYEPVEDAATADARHQRWLRALAASREWVSPGE